MSLLAYAKPWGRGALGRNFRKFLFLFDVWYSLLLLLLVVVLLLLLYIYNIYIFFFFWGGGVLPKKSD